MLRCPPNICPRRKDREIMHAAVLRYFDHVARLGSIRRAAETLNVASSAVNRQILKLEEETGAVLFERLRTGVRLTAAGEVLLRHARETLIDYDRARADMATLSGTVTGSVRIISLESLIVRFMPEVVAELARAYPQMTLTVVVVDPSAIADELRSGRNDFGVLFVDNRYTRVDVVETFSTSIGAVMRPDHPLASRRKLTLTECAKHPVLMLNDRWLLDVVMATEFAQSGARLVPRIVSNSIDFMRQMIMSDLGIGFFTPIGFIDEIARGELVHVPLAEPRLNDSEIGIMVPQDRRPTVAGRIAMDIIRLRLREFARTMNVPGATRKARVKKK
jgi:DNA-binding transcriptional LysR family regulator